MLTIESTFNRLNEKVQMFALITDNQYALNTQTLKTDDKSNWCWLTCCKTQSGVAHEHNKKYPNCCITTWHFNAWKYDNSVVYRDFSRTLDEIDSFFITSSVVLSPLNYPSGYSWISRLFSKSMIWNNYWKLIIASLCKSTSIINTQ